MRKSTWSSCLDSTLRPSKSHPSGKIHLFHAIYHLSIVHRKFCHLPSKIFHFLLSYLIQILLHTFSHLSISKDLFHAFCSYPMSLRIVFHQATCIFHIQIFHCSESLQSKH